MVQAENDDKLPDSVDVFSDFRKLSNPSDDITAVPSPAVLQNERRALMSTITEQEAHMETSAHKKHNVDTELRMINVGPKFINDSRDSLTMKQYVTQKK